MVVGRLVQLASPRRPAESVKPTLIALAGLPGTGKTTIARELARRIGAVHIRIDSIEQALRESGRFEGRMDDAGYRVAYAVAEDNLRQGLTVVADSVNPIALTRDAWSSVATRAGVKLLEVELICTDQTEHRHRIETREADIPGHKLPTWNEVVAREYDPWSREHVVIDTAQQNTKQAIEVIRKALQKRL
jgi:predicted kinase